MASKVNAVDQKGVTRYFYLSTCSNFLIHFSRYFFLSSSGPLFLTGSPGQDLTRKTRARITLKGRGARITLTRGGGEDSSGNKEISLVGGSVEVTLEGVVEVSFGVDNEGGQRCSFFS